MNDVLNVGSALDGKKFYPGDEAVLAERAKFPDITEELALGNVLEVYNDRLKEIYGDPLPETAEITLTAKNILDFPDDFMPDAKEGDIVAVPFGNLAKYY